MTVIDGVVEFAARNPVVVGLLVAMLGFVFFMYLLVRRTLMGLREGYESGQRRR